MIPKEFHEDAKRLGEAGWDNLEKAWDEWERYTTTFALEQGMKIWREGRRIWGTRDGEMYLLASATEPGADPMNLWANAFSKIECWLMKQES